MQVDTGIPELVWHNGRTTQKRNHGVVQVLANYARFGKGQRILLMYSWWNWQHVTIAYWTPSQWSHLNYYTDCSGVCG